MIIYNNIYIYICQYYVKIVILCVVSRDVPHFSGQKPLDPLDPWREDDRPASWRKFWCREAMDFVEAFEM